MTIKLFRTDPYLRETESIITGLSEAGGVIVDRSVFYPAGGGQPGDTGKLTWNTGSACIVDSRNCGHEDVELVLAEGAATPPTGEAARQELDWNRRFCHMRIHTALHLLSVVVPFPVSGGAISAEKGRLDFNMPEAVANKDELEGQLNRLVERDLPVTEDWITDEELAANPSLVKTMSVKPPIGAGRVRLVRIGELDDQIDLQPCGGTHVARTGEIGALAIGKVEKKGRLNRRINIRFAV